MAKYHLGKNGPAQCRATVKACPLGGEESHFPSFQEAQKAYEESFKGKELKSLSKSSSYSYTQELMKAGAGKYPTELLAQLGEHLDSRPYKTLSLIPAGSDLYGTKIPGRATHDHDFTAFVTPHRSQKKMTQYLKGELDITFVAVDKIADVSGRSVPLTEAFYAHQKGLALITREDPEWGPYLKNLRLPVQRYFDTVSDVMRSNNQSYVEPVSQEDKVNFRNFKHNVRWALYQRRWGTEGPNFMDPQLSPDERRRFLRAIESGWLNSIED